MKIALLTYSTRPRGGVVHTLALAEALVRAGAEVDVWTLARGGDSGFFREVDPAVRIRAVDFAEGEQMSVGERIVAAIDVLGKAFNRERDQRDRYDRQDRYDIVHAQDCISANAALPCLRTVHHLDQFTTPELVACHDRAIREPDQLLAVSTAVASEVAAQYGVQPTVIPNGVDAARFAAGEADLARRKRWREQLGSYVIALGGIEPRKGSIDLLEGFALLDRPDLRLVFAGGETLFDYRDYRATFEARAAELGVEPRIIGTIAEADLPALVAEAAALAMVSTKEGFGLAAMEALAAGVPVVTRDLPVLREVFADTVLMATDPAGIAEALRAQLEAPLDAEAGRELAARYTWDAAARRHLEVYRVLTQRVESNLAQQPD